MGRRLHFIKKILGTFAWRMCDPGSEIFPRWWLDASQMERSHGGVNSYGANTGKA
jgi:hypothetical protein